MSYWTRRSLLQGTSACLALVAGNSLAPRSLLAAPQTAESVTSKPYARVFKLAQGVWAIESTPFSSGDLTTTCNGGIIAGRDGVLVVEGFNTLRGGAWVSQLTRELTGRRPTHVVVTHFHADHTNGLAGFQNGADELTIMATARTRQLIVERYAASPVKPEGSSTVARGRKFLLPDSVIVDTSRPTEIDLGGRHVTLIPRQGHTPSDLTVQIDEPLILWPGDLLWNGLFPNYVDAIPTQLRKSCHELLTMANARYVPGHGPLTDAEGIRPYLGLLDSVEEAARKAHSQGTPAADAWQAYEVPSSLGEWSKFRPDIFRPAFEAWERELGG